MPGSRVSTKNRLSVLLLLTALGIPAIAQHQEEPRALMFRARAKQRRAGGDNPKGAAALYRKVIALEPTSAEAHLRLSEALLEASEIEAAVEPARKATELDPRNAEAWVHLGLLQYLRATTKPAAQTEARRALREAAKLMPNDPEIWLRLAQISQTLKDDEGALRAWIRLGRLHPPLSFQEHSLEDIAWERAALLASTLNHYEYRREAVMALCQRFRPDSQHLRFLEELAREQVDKGFLGHAEESFLLLAQHFSQEPAVWENVARIQIETGHFEAALKSLHQAQALRPTLRASYFLGTSLMNLGRTEEADKVWRDFFSKDSTSPDDEELVQSARALFGSCLLMEGKPQELLDQLEKWSDPDKRGDLLAMKAQGLIQTHAWKTALTVLQDGIARYPEQTLFRSAKAMPSTVFTDGTIFKSSSHQAMVQLDIVAMASLWSDFRQWEKSLALALQARKLGTYHSVDLLLLKSNDLEQLGRSQEAIQTLREAQKLQADQPTLQNNLGYLLLENGGDLDEASRLIEAALKQDPKSGSTMDSWGWLLFRQGKFQEAEEALRKAIEVTPYSPEIRRHMGEVLLKLDRPEEALAQWERALAYAFPQRKELEEQVQKLRIEVAKRQQVSERTGDAPVEPDDPEDPADGENP